MYNLRKSRFENFLEVCCKANIIHNFLKGVTMNKKIIILLIVFGVILVCIGFGCGKIFGNMKEESNIKYELRNCLEGIYLTEEKGDSSAEKEVKHSYIDCLTFYNNGTVSVYRINIYNVKGIGVKISNGTIRLGRYTLSNESKTILINYNSISEILSFDNNYKTIKSDNIEYNLITGNVQDNIPQETILKERNTEFSGTYLNEKIKNKSTKNNRKQYKGKDLDATIERKYLTFLENGNVKIKNEIINKYADGTDEMIGGLNNEHEYQYSIDKENKTLLQYATTYMYINYKISDDFKLIRDNNGEIYTLIE